MCKFFHIAGKTIHYSSLLQDTTSSSEEGTVYPSLHPENCQQSQYLKHSEVSMNQCGKQLASDQSETRHLGKMHLNNHFQNIRHEGVGGLKVAEMEKRG